MLTLSTAVRERHETFVTVEVTVNDYAVPSTQQFFAITVDRVTNEASVFHQGRVIKTTHDLALDATELDVEAFCICATVSMLFNIKG